MKRKLLIILATTMGLCCLCLYYWYHKTHYFYMTTQSMEPTIKEGEGVKIRSFNKNSEISRWDLVVVKFPRNRKEVQLRRVVGLPKERIEIFNTHIEINDKELELISGLKNKNFKCSGTKLTIPENYLYLMGDNVEISYDSRHYGCIPIGDVIGIVKGDNGGK